MKISLEEYIDKAKELMATDPTLTEIYSLDVIGDWKASLKNAEAMWKSGVQAIPCYHKGEPESVLMGLASDYPKIAFGGAVGIRAKEKNDWAGQCFSRVWPKKVHGFGFGGEKSIMSLPFHSVDATNWEIGPCKYGQWKSFGVMSVRGSKQNLRAEMEWYLALERKARGRWVKEMALLDGLSAKGLKTSAGSQKAPVVRLGVQGNGRNQSPTVGLALSEVHKSQRRSSL